MDIQKFAIKYFLEKGQSVEPETWFRTFNSWIPDEKDEVWIDVADYSHVREGPVTLLVGHEANYCIDNGNGNLGLLYTRKRPVDGTLSNRLETAFKAVCTTCHRLEEDVNVKFDGSRAQLALNDRLSAPNTSETMEAVRDDLEKVINKLYSGAKFSIEKGLEERNRLTININVEGSWSVGKLLENL